MSNILIISFSQLAIDSRVKRQICFLKDKYAVTAAGYGSSNIPGINHIPLESRHCTLFQKAINATKLLSRQFESYYWNHPRTKAAIAALSKGKYDLIIANDLESLPLALHIANGAKVLYDAHEFAPEEFDEQASWRLFYKRYKESFCRKYLKRADKMMTVCQGIADAYQQQFAVSPFVLTNATHYQDLSPTQTDSKHIKLVCHGMAMQSRKLETLIEMFEYLDSRFTLDLYLIPFDKEYKEKLIEMAANYPQIQFPDAVSSEKIVDTLHQYDIGVYLLTPSNFNNHYSLPNKFFEFIQARLALGIGPSPEMEHLVRKYECGIIAPHFEAATLAKALNTLSAEEIMHFKKKADAAAKELCSEANKNLLQREVAQLLELKN